MTVIPVSMQWIQPLLETQEASAAAAFILHPLVPPAYRILNLLTPFRCCMTLFPAKGQGWCITMEVLISASILTAPEVLLFSHVAHCYMMTPD